MNNDAWSKEFPKEPGDYWFYGYRYGRKSCGYDCKPEWMRVMVRACANGLLYVAEGQFMHKAEVEDAHFKKIDYPELPEMFQEDNEPPIQQFDSCSDCGDGFSEPDKDCPDCGGSGTVPRN